MAFMSAITWLHLSDFHYETKLLRDFWGNIENILFDDLKFVCSKTGPPDLIFFTGDLVQKGSKKNFKELNEKLLRIYDFFEEEFEVRPTLLCVPGNHDLIRPEPTKPEAILLKEWLNYPQVQNTFWNDPKNPYLKVVKNAFKHYTDWSKGYFNELQIPEPSQIQFGYLPGDFAATVKKDGIRLGIVGLNTAFLQLTDDPYKGNLAVHPTQLISVVGDFPIDWEKQHDFCILLTHHPAEWFNEEARLHFEGEICLGGRFGLHLFGHMHKQFSKITLKYGNKEQRIFCVRPLFGSEKCENDRLHGYTVGRLDFQRNKQACTLRYWPREAIPPSRGGWQLERDNSFTPFKPDGGTKPSKIKIEKFISNLGSRISSETSTAELTKTKTIHCAFQSLLECPGFFDNLDDLPEEVREELATIMKGRIDDLQRDLHNELQAFNVVVVGSACTDAFVKTDDLLTAHSQPANKANKISYSLGSKILISELVFHTGGGGANASATFAKLGLKTAFIGKIGADMRGHRIFESLNKNNITFLGSIAPERTGFSVILRGSAQDHVALTYRGSGNNLTLNEIPEVKRGKYWLYGASAAGRSFETQGKLFASAKRKSNEVKTAYCPSLYICRMGLKHLISILKNTDVLILNKEGAINLVGPGEAIELAEKLACYGPGIVSVSQDVQGVSIYEKESNKKIHVKPSSKAKLTIKDTTGAGDAFGAGFIAGLFLKKDIEQAALLGVLNAEHVIRDVGANKGIPDLETAKRMLANSDRYVEVIM